MLLFCRVFFCYTASLSITVLRRRVKGVWGSFLMRHGMALLYLFLPFVFWAKCLSWLFEM